MNWITRCPDCATFYQVTSEQLQLAKGWLRCGQCQHVFDSTGLVLAWSDSGSAVIPRVSDVPPAERLEVEDLLEHEDRSSESTHSYAAMDLVSFEEALSSFKPKIEKTITEFSSASSMIAAAESLDQSADTQSPDLIALNRRSPSVLWAWVLLLGISIQWLWIERHALIARWPAMEAPFKAVCRAIICQSEYRRDVNAMVIDSSSFIQRDEGHEFSWTITNSSEQAVQMTALELTLQDVQGRTVLRRVLWPADVGAPAVLMPGQIWAGKLFVHVDADIPMTGYRVLSFYP